MDLISIRTSIISVFPRLIFRDNNMKYMESKALSNRWHSPPLNASHLPQLPEGCFLQAIKGLLSY